VIQLFDSGSALSAADYEFVAPYSARILAAVDVPTTISARPSSKTCCARSRAPEAT
jgi:hypothetical protein